MPAMVGPSKILTVSYGTFSCTLEGFEDPFNTMKAIAEYFRDLAAEDRYFGAEPPQPDAAMLHRIAEREVQRRVEAKVQDNGVILRAEAAPQAAVAAPQVRMPAQPPRPSFIVEDAAPAALSAVTPSVVAPSESLSDSVAEKLRRLRAASRPAEVAAVAAAAVPAVALAAAMPESAEAAVAEAAPPEAVQAEAALTALAGDGPDPAAPVAEAPVADIVPEVDAASVAAPVVSGVAPVAIDPDRAAAIAAAFADDEDIAEAPEWEEEAAAALADPDDMAMPEAAPESVAEADFGAEAAQPSRVTDDAGADEPVADATPDAAVADDVSAPEAEGATEARGLQDGGTADDVVAGDDLADEDLAGDAVADAEPVDPVTEDAAPEEDDLPELPQDAAEQDADAALIAALTRDAPAADATPDTAPVSHEADDDQALFDPLAGDDSDDALIAALMTAEAAPEVEAAADLPAEEPAPETSVFEAEAAGADIVEAEDAEMVAADLDTVEADILEAEDPDVDAAAPVAVEAEAEADEPEAFEPEAVEPAAVEPEAVAPEAVADGAVVVPEAAAPQIGAETEPADAAPDADAAAATALAGPAADKLQRARARVIKIRRIEVPAAAASPALTPEAEAELARELAALRGDAVDPATAPLPATQPRTVMPTRPTLPEAPEDTSVKRLLDAANSQMEDPESRRRLAAIAHMKAAVAATEADRKVGSGAEGQGAETRLTAYRSDLEQVVRPRRPVSGSASTAAPGTPATAGSGAAPGRPAPLVLVSAQRIDRPASAEPPPQPAARPSAPVQPVRPRRVGSVAYAQPSAAPVAADMPIVQSRTTGSAVVDEDDLELEGDDEDTDNVFASSAGFAEFAERLGATELADLLEAAAAYAACVEGRPSVTRPQLIRRVHGVMADAEPSREDMLRSFGRLLRDGRIEKVRRGQFAVREDSRIMAEARKIAG